MLLSGQPHSQGLTILDADGNPRAILALYDSSGPTLILLDEAGDPVFEAPAP